MLNIKVKIDVDTAKLNSKQKNSKQSAQMWLDQDVLKDSNYFIPQDESTLMASGISNSLIGQGKIMWVTPYARRLYYNPQYNFSKDMNPNAQGLWFEAAKAQKRSNWLETVYREYGKYFDGE